MEKIKTAFIKQISIIVFCLCMLVPIPISLCQLEHEFAPVGTEWYYGMTFAASFAEHYNTYYCIKDTIIDSKSCKIVNEMIGTCNGINTVFYFYQDSDKVYYSEPDNDSASENSFLLLYDFGKIKGESWWIVIKNYKGYDLEYDSLLVTVNEIRDTIIGNDTLSLMDVSIDNSDYWVGFNGLIYKYIGHEHDLFPFLNKGCDMNFNNLLRCYNDSINSLFCDFDTLHSCDYTTVGIIDIQDFKLNHIFPNPANDFITLIVENMENISGKIEIYNMLGQLMLKQNSWNKTTIDISSFPQGLYVLKAKTADGICVKKFVKE